jgi:predicted RND superfamily exporter protein
VANTSANVDTAFHRAAERFVFGNRVAIMVVFAVITAVMLYFAAQLRVDAGFKKQIPTDHEYIDSFLAWEKEFGGANRVLVAVMDRSGSMFPRDDTPAEIERATRFFGTVEKLTNDIIALDEVDDSRVRSIFTPNVRFVEVVEDGFAGGNVIPQEFVPNAEGFVPSRELFDTIRANMVKANAVGRYVAKDFSGAMIWGELVPEGGAGQQKLDYQRVASSLEELRRKYETDPEACRLYESGQAASGNGTCVHVIGFAKMVGDIADGARSVIYFFFLTIALTWLLLFLYSTSVKLASLTVFAGLISVIWMLGALRLMGFGIDPMNMLTPFLIFAIAVSHGEQMINRFRGEIFFGGLEDGTVAELRQRQGVDSLEAARRSFKLLLVPGSVALIAGCIGFATILIIPIRIIYELAITATVGVALTILTDLILLPLLLSYTKLRNMERKREFRLRQLTQFDKVWAVLSRLSRPVPAAVVIALGVTAWFFAERQGDKVMVGDAQQGVAELREDARYNQDARLITEKFALSVDIINVIAEAAPAACTQSFKVMELIDRFSWHMSNVEGVQQVISLPMAAKIVNAGWNEGNIRWRVLPRDTDQLRVATQGFETDSGLLNDDCSGIPILIFVQDHRATTIDRVVAAVDEFRRANDANDVNFRLRNDTLASVSSDLPAGVRANFRKTFVNEVDGKQAVCGELLRQGGEQSGASARFVIIDGKPLIEGATEAGEFQSAYAASCEEVQPNRANLRLATGNVGVMAAINDKVREVEAVMLYLLYAAVFLMCLLSFRSALAALCITLPLVLVTELGHTLMVHLGIGMKVNTLTVVALGVGIGVDYAIYIFARMNEAMHSGRTLSESYFVALKTTGIAIFYTALTLAVGVAMWMFSDLKFQADMGTMLTFMFVVNMIAAIVFLPALCRWLLRPFEKDDWQPPKAETLA